MTRRARQAQTAPAAAGGTRFSLTRPVLAAGAVAAALGSILALASSLGGVFSGAPVGDVTTFTLQPPQPLSYGEWRDHEHVSTAGVSPAERRRPGRLVAYDLDTEGFPNGAVLPVRIILHDLTNARSTTIAGDPIEVTDRRDCGCFDWVAVPNGPARYFLEVAVFPPGGVGEQPLKSASSAVFAVP